MLFGDLLFWLPALVSASLIVLLDGGIRARSPWLLLAFVGALLAQVFSVVYSPGWVAGIVVQTVLALGLSLRMKLEG